MSGADNWGYSPEAAINSQAQFIEELSLIVGMDWRNTNVWTRHEELKLRIQALVAFKKEHQG